MPLPCHQSTRPAIENGKAGRPVTAVSPAPMAGLPGSSTSVLVVPPVLRSSARLGSAVLTRSEAGKPLLLVTRLLWPAAVPWFTTSLPPVSWATATPLTMMSSPVLSPTIELVRKRVAPGALKSPAPSLPSRAWYPSRSRPRCRQWLR